MKRLFIDAGVTSGFALFDDSTLVSHGVIVHGTCENEFGRLRLQRPDEVIIEFPIARGIGLLQARLRDVEGILRQVFPSHKSIGPGRWKPWAKIRQKHGITPPITFVAQHDKDAYWMGVWYLRTQAHAEG